MNKNTEKKKVISVRLTKDEYEAVNEYHQNTGLPFLSDSIRGLINVTLQAYLVSPQKKDIAWVKFLYLGSHSLVNMVHIFSQMYPDNKSDIASLESIIYPVTKAYMRMLDRINTDEFILTKQEDAMLCDALMANMEWLSKLNINECSLKLNRIRKAFRLDELEE